MTKRFADRTVISDPLSSMP